MIGGELLLPLIAAVTFSPQISPSDTPRAHLSQMTEMGDHSDHWIVDTSVGFPIRIAYSSAVKTQNYSDQVIFLFIEDQYCSPEYLRKVFTEMAARFLKADSLEIDVYSDAEMLRRAIVRYRSYPDDMIFPDTPEGIELEKMIRGKTYIPKTGWARARYFKGRKSGVRFFYKTDPQKIEMTEVILKPRSALKYTGQLQTDLFLACQSGDLDKAKDLISDGARIDDGNEAGETPLVYAVAHNSPDIVKLLLGSGAYVDAKNKYGQTVLNEALSHGFREIFNILVEHGADVNACYGPGISPLYLAAYAGDVEAVEALLTKGADPNAPDADGNTPLFGAIRTRKTKIVRALLERGASVNVRNKRGQTPLALALELGDQAIIASLK
jgi:Ankyrin repeats (3 copies)